MKACKCLPSLDSLIPLYDSFIYCMDHLSSLQNSRALCSLKALEMLQSKYHRKVFILSTDSTYTREEFAAHLKAKYGFLIDSSFIYTAGYLAGKYLKANCPSTAKTVYYIGTEGLRKELSSLGFTPIGSEDASELIKDQRIVLAKAKERKIDAVVVGLDRGFSAYKIFMACFAVELGAKFLVTSRQISFEENGMTLPDVGAIVAGIEVSTGKVAECLFGQSCFLFKTILEENLVKDPQRVLVITGGNGGFGKIDLDTCCISEDSTEPAGSRTKYWINCGNLI